MEDYIYTLSPWYDGVYVDTIYTLLWQQIH